MMDKLYVDFGSQCEGLIKPIPQRGLGFGKCPRRAVSIAVKIAHYSTPSFYSMGRSHNYE